MPGRIPTERICATPERGRRVDDDDDECASKRCKRGNADWRACIINIIYSRIYIIRLVVCYGRGVYRSYVPIDPTDPRPAAISVCARAVNYPFRLFSIHNKKRIDNIYHRFLGNTDDRFLGDPWCGVGRGRLILHAPTRVHCGCTPL